MSEIAGTVPDCAASVRGGDCPHPAISDRVPGSPWLCGSESCRFSFRETGTAPPKWGLSRAESDPFGSPSVIPRSSEESRPGSLRAGSGALRDCPHLAPVGTVPPSTCPKPHDHHRASRAQSRVRGPSANHFGSSLPSHHHNHLASPPASRVGTHSANHPANLFPVQPAKHLPCPGQNRPANPGRKGLGTGLPNHPGNRSRDGSQGDSRGVVLGHLQRDGSAKLLPHSELRKWLQRGKDS